MTKMRRFVGVVGFLGLAAYVSTSLQGQPGTKAPGAVTTPQLTPANQVSQLADASESRFGNAGVVTYQPVTGDAYFALQLKPKLDAAPARPRDILVMLSTAATQGGSGWISGHQIAEGVLDAAREFDRISLWTANAPENTKNISKEFLMPKDYGENKRLRDALAQYRAKEYPAGDTDLKNALDLAIKSFDAAKSDRQRIILFLGDGLSTHNPMTEDDRLKIARQMVMSQIAFFPVPLGVQLNPNTLHGLANSTGGVVLRTRVDEEKVGDAMKRYEEAFAGAVLYGAELKVPAGITDVCPSVLPPLRGDSPTLVVGRLKKAVKQLDFTITGIPAGKKASITVTGSETVLAPNLDNYFLVSMIDQWVKAKDYPAVLRADRALIYTYEQTRLQHQEYLTTAQAALQDDKVEAAGRLFQQARQLAPHDGQADAGIKIVDRLKDGTLNKEMLRKQFKQAKVDQLRLVDGKPQWVKVDLIALAQDEKAPDKKLPGVEPKGGNIAPENLLKEHRDRQAIEEQKIANAVDDAIRQARRNLANDPDGTLDLLKNLKSRVQDHPDLGAQVRDALVSRLQTSLRESATDVQRLKLKKAGEQQAVAVAEKNLTREQERRSFEEKTDAQFRIYKGLMLQARYEEKTKSDILQAMVQIQDEARLKGHPVPLATKAMYDVALAALPLQTHNTLIRRREANWLSILMGIEKAHIPYPDEPHIHFPPLATWKALSDYRKAKYASINFPSANEKGSEDAAAVVKLLAKTIETKDFSEPRKLKKVIEIISDSFGGKLSIVVDTGSFMSGDEAGAPDPYDQNVVLPDQPSKISLGTALDIMAAQAGKGGTYIVNRDHVLITTYKRVLEEKVQRVHPVGDLFTMPFQMSNTYSMMQAGGMGMGGMMMGGMPGMMMGGMPGMMMGGMPGMMAGGMPGMMMGGMPGMMAGGMPGMMMGGMPGMMAGGMPGMMMGGMPGMMAGGMPGMMMGGMPGMMAGGMPGMMMGGMPMGGGMGMGGMQMGGGMQGQQMGGGGSDIMQAQGLMKAVALIVRPGSWNLQQMVPPGFMMGMFPMGMFGMGFPGMMGMMGMGGMMGMAGMVGAPPPGDPNFTGDPLTSNSISYFPAGLAIVVNAPARIHTTHISVVGGSRPKLPGPAGALERDPKGNVLVKVEPKIDPKADPNDPKVVANNDPAKLWNDAFAKGGINVGHVIATADFLFGAGEFNHAAHFLKANLRAGIVVRPWVFESLAVALEMSGGDKDEIRRVRLSGIALDPTDAQGFLSAARAMADRGQHDRALAFCKQAALLEPTDYHPYEFALAYAENAKDAKGMEWAVGNLVSQDWPVDNVLIQAVARKRLSSLASALKSEKRSDEAGRLEATLDRLNQRDLTVQLVWENTGGACELEMKVKEPSGSVCSLEHKQSPGGGVMLPYNLTDKTPSSQYIVSQAFSGDYEIAIARIYGQPLGNRARLIVTRNAGTKQEVRSVEIVQLDKSVTFKVNLKDGRRTELASVSPAAVVRHQAAGVQRDVNVVYDLRAIANPNFYGATGPRGSAGTSGASIPTVASLASKDKNNAPQAPIMQNAFNHNGGGVQMTAQVRMNPDNRNYEMVIRPFFDAAARAGRPAVNLSVIPGGGN